MDSMVQKGDRNPKDFILVNKGRFTHFTTTKDNTGDRKYIENSPFPSLGFPSDHGIVFTTMQPLPATAEK